MARAGHEAHVAERDWLWRVLLELPPRQRAALVCRFYDDLSEAQTAEALGCAPGRWAGAACAAVLAVGPVVSLPGVLSGGTDGLVADVPDDRQDPIAWARGTVLHTSPGGPEVELGRQPVALVQGTSGFVFSDSEGGVHVVLDDRVLEVGRLEAPDAAAFESEATSSPGSAPTRAERPTPWWTCPRGPASPGSR